MQLSSYDHLTPDNIIFNEAKEYKVKIARSNANVFQLKLNIQMERKDHL